MAFIPVLNAAKVELIGRLDLQQVVNVFWVRKATPFDEAALTTLANTFKSWYTTNYKLQMTAAYSLERIVCTAQDTASSPGFTLVISPAEPGTAAGSPMPNNVAVVATHRTAQRGRNFRGRTYIPAVSQNLQFSPGTLTPGAASGIASAIFTLKAAIDAIAMIWVVASKFFNKLPRAVGLTTPVTAVSVDTPLDSQRRRLPGRGA